MLMDSCNTNSNMKIGYYWKDRRICQEAFWKHNIWQLNKRLLQCRASTKGTYNSLGCPFCCALFVWYKKRQCCRQMHFFTLLGISAPLLYISWSSLVSQSFIISSESYIIACKIKIFSVLKKL